MRNVVVKDSIVIAAPPEKVWDYTQDWTRRHEWDPGIVSAEILQAEPRIVRARGKGFVTMMVRYKLVDRPKKTSLEMTEFRPGVFAGGGGSWTYEAEGAGTRFSQVNTMKLGTVAYVLIGWLVRIVLTRNTRKSLEIARRILEST